MSSSSPVHALGPYTCLYFHSSAVQSIILHLVSLKTNLEKADKQSYTNQWIKLTKKISNLWLGVELKLLFPLWIKEFKVVKAFQKKMHVFIAFCQFNGKPLFFKTDFPALKINSNISFLFYIDGLESSFRFQAVKNGIIQWVLF